MIDLGISFITLGVMMLSTGVFGLILIYRTNRMKKQSELYSEKELLNIYKNKDINISEAEKRKIVESDFYHQTGIKANREEINKFAELHKKSKASYFELIYLKRFINLSSNNIIDIRISKEPYLLLSLVVILIAVFVLSTIELDTVLHYAIVGTIGFFIPVIYRSINRMYKASKLKNSITNN